MMQDGTLLRILLVEDDADTRASLRRILALDGSEIEAVATSAEALERAARSSYSTILLDRMLPDGTAAELLPELKRLAPGADVIVLTGFGDVEGAISALRQGASDYLLKPINPDDLRARIALLAEHRRAGEELQRRSLILQSVLKQVNDVAIVVDGRGRILLRSPAAERVFGTVPMGAPPEDWPVHGVIFRRDTVTPYRVEDLPLSRALGGEEVSDEELFVRLPGESAGRWMSTNASPLRGPEGVEGAVVILRDITERKRAADELRRQRDLAEGLIAAAPAVVLMLDPEGRVTRFNEYAEQLSGFQAEEVLGRDFFTTFLPERDRVRIGAVFRETLEEVDTCGTVNPIVTKDGRERVLRWSNRVLRDSDERIIGVLAIGQDITDLKEAQARALHAERLAAIGQTVAGLAHESRNALQRGRACAEMLALELPDRPRALDLLARLQRAQDDLAHLYEDVRDYAAPVHVRPRPCDLAEVWRNAWADLEPVRRGRSAFLRESIEAADLCSLVDPSRMGQVFRNLLENALAACADPVEIAITCAADELEGQAALRIAVRDNGPGLAPEQRARVFEAFYTTKTKGTGLGLAISRRIVEAHGGRIALAESNGQGAEFLIILPYPEL